jgi:hypothetical protein
MGGAPHRNVWMEQPLRSSLYHPGTKYPSGQCFIVTNPKFCPETDRQCKSNQPLIAHQRESTVNVFVLCCGRCGSTTFAQAASYAQNFTSGHETRAGLLGSHRLDYQDHHIEVDNRLAWFLGALDREYGKAAYYVHLTRDPEAIAKSYNQRWHLRGTIMRGYSESILIEARADPIDMCRDYVATVSENISFFLRDKPNVVHVRLENIQEDFAKFWDWIGAAGDRDSAIDIWRHKFNATHNAKLTEKVELGKNLPRRTQPLENDS